MTNAERMALLMTVFNAIFQSKAENTNITQVKIQTNTGTWPGRWFKDSTTGQQTLRGFDFTCNLGDRIISLRCLEQNPNKTDNLGNLKKFALLARQGHKIMWVIDRNGSFLGHIMDGKWEASWKPATQPAQYNQAAAQSPAPTPPQAPQLPDNVPTIPDGIGIPEYVLREILADDSFVDNYPVEFEEPEWDY